MMERSMECQYIPPENLPGTTPLYKAFLTDFSKVSHFYAHPPSFDSILRVAQEMRFDDATRRSVVEVLRQQNSQLGGDASTIRNLDRLAAGAVAVVTGQQVGLLGGPAFSIYKALTAIRVARELTARGVETVPVFWLATEDHDLDEVDHTVFASRGKFEEFTLPVAESAGRRVGEIKLGEAIGELAARAAQALDGPAAEEATKWITDSYGPAETFGTAFGKLMARIFGGRGLIFLDPLSPELHRLSASTMRGAIEDHEVLSQELIARSAALEQAGYHAQVKVAEHSTLVFRIVDGQRLSLRPGKSGFDAGGLHESLEDTLKSLERSPADFSANALLRPVIQDTLLPTVAYVGGPAEVAYYAQVSVIQKRLLGRAPVILPRAAFTIVLPHVANLLRKYNLEVAEILKESKNLRAKLEAEVLPEALSAQFETGERTIQGILDELREPVLKLDPTLVGALENTAEKIKYQFSGLRTKAARAEGFRIGVLDGHEREILNSLFPKHALQERTLSPLPFIANVGPVLLNQLYEHIRVGTGEHCVIHV
jgi:bacillithiol biosynthesis cysteine-adding enzyme BshC